MRRRNRIPAWHRRTLDAAERGWAKNRPPIIFADAGHAVVPVQHLQSASLLGRWPTGYTGFRLDGETAVLFGKGKPDIHLETS
jgi:hypothetical protein